MEFWPLAIALAALVALLILLALLRRRRDHGGDEAESDIAIYRQQLAAVEQDVERGTISEEEAERLRVEISRRLLAADRALAAASRGGMAPRGASLVAGGAALAVIIGGGVFLYMRIGAPGYPDLPISKRIEMATEFKESRPGQAAVEAEIGADGPFTPPPGADPKYLELMEKLRETVKSRPGELRGQQLLARNEAALGNFPAAWRAQQKVIALKGAESGADDYAELAELMILATRGYVSPEAEAALMQALQRNPEHGLALYYTGLMFAQNRREDLAFRIWSRLLENSPPDARWIPELRASLPEVARIAGVKYELPPEPGRDAAPGPSREDIANAAEMSEEERQEMIRSMVERLDEELASEGGPPEKWARLITAYGVLGEKERAREIRDEARKAFAGQEAGLAKINAAAARAGLTD